VSLINHATRKSNRALVANQNAVCAAGIRTAHSAPANPAATTSATTQPGHLFFNSAHHTPTAINPAPASTAPRAVSACRQSSHGVPPSTHAQNPPSVNIAAATPATGNTHQPHRKNFRSASRTRIVNSSIAPLPQNWK
jgi:hypothetical protein